MFCVYITWSCCNYLDSFSVRYVFALNMFELGCINTTEWAVYQDWHSLLVEKFGHQVELEGIIYLRASPKVWPQNVMQLSIQHQTKDSNNSVYLSGLYGPSEASGQVWGERTETGLSGKAAYPAWEVAGGEKHWVSETVISVSLSSLWLRF